MSNITKPRIKNVATGNITSSISDYFLEFFFSRISFLIILATRKMLKYMTGVDLIRNYF